LLAHFSSILIHVPQKGITFSALAIGNGTYKIDLQSGIMSMENISSSPTSNIGSNITLPKNKDLDNKVFFFTRVPLVSVNGTASFPEAYVPNYINDVFGDSILNKGNLHFSFDSSSDSVIVLTDFGYSPNFDNGQKTANDLWYRWEIAVPLDHGLPFSLLLVTTAFLIILSIVFIRRRLNNRNY
jgi:hypothetical protein